MSYKCPHCQAVIYNRRHPLCGVCEKTLPEELLFTVAEREALDRTAARWAEDSRARENVRKENGGALFGGIFVDGRGARSDDREED